MANFNINYHEKCMPPVLSNIVVVDNDVTITWQVSSILSGQTYKLQKSIDGGAYTDFATVAPLSGTYTGNIGLLGNISTDFRLVTTTTNCALLTSNVLNYQPPSFNICDYTDLNDSETETSVSRFNVVNNLDNGISNNELITAKIRITSGTSVPVPLKLNTVYSTTLGTLNLNYRRLIFYPDVGSQVILQSLPTSTGTGDNTYNINYQFPGAGYLALEMGPIAGWTGSNAGQSLEHYIYDTVVIDDGGFVNTCLALTAQMQLTVPMSSSLP